LGFERAPSLRRIKPQRKAGAIARRADIDLPLVGRPGPGAELLLDTCVYLDVLQGKTPIQVDELLQLRIVNHSTVALAELTHLYGRLDPNHSGTRKVLTAISAVIDDIPAHRLTAPSARAFGEAGMLAGLVMRLGGRPGGLDLLNDALLFLQARETGCALLTANISDFDVFDQVLPGSGLLLYRTP
jgi:predicted nucleic acid-binding protein